MEHQKNQENKRGKHSFDLINSTESERYAMSKKKKHVPQVIILDTPQGKEEYDFYLFRVVDCDDGVTRLEPLKPTDLQHLSKDDPSKNQFVTGYVHNGLSKMLGW